MKKNLLYFMFLSAIILSLVGCGGSSETAAGDGSAVSQNTIEGTVDLYLEAINNEDIDAFLKTIHPFSSQHVTLRGFYDRDFAQFDYDVKKVSVNIVEETESSATVELVFSKTLVTEKGEGQNELAEGEHTQKLTLKTKGEEWTIDKIE